MQSHVHIMSTLRSLDREREQHMATSRNLKALDQQQSTGKPAVHAAPAPTLSLARARRPWRPLLGWMTRFAT